MQLTIHNGAVDLSGMPILTNINIEINTNSRIAVVGRNGCGKTTLIRLLSGELSLASSEGDGSFFAVSGNPVIGRLDQISFKDDSVTLLEAVRGAYGDILSMKSRLDELLELMNEGENEKIIAEYTSLLERFTDAGGFYFEKEYEAAIKRFGFTDADKYRPVSQFSGGQRTKIAFLRLLLSKPDLLLLDEPTNHLDINAVTWLEDYLAGYKKAVVIVSHDRMFLDKTVTEVYEIEHGKTERYVGNYSDFTVKKKEQRALQAKKYEAQQKEIERLNAVAERFRYKATKAAMAQSKLKQIERMEKIDAPDSFDNRTFKGSVEPNVRSAKEVLKVNELEIGFSRPLACCSFEVLRGQRLGIIGGNGLGKSTLLKTLTGKLPSLGGSYSFGAAVVPGYFDQQMALYAGSETVFDNFLNAFPHYNDFEVRSALGAFLFSGEDVFKTLDMLSGGERVRLALCKLFRKNPNLLLLDEPTNHMDILSKETLEELLDSYEGTLIFVSHDRYFTKKLADKLLVFTDNGVRWYEHGYEQYEEELKGQSNSEQIPQLKTETVKPPKKSFTTPGKERSKKERALKKAEEKIALLEEKIAGLSDELKWDENLSDYLKLGELQAEIEAAEEELLNVMAEWEELSVWFEENEITPSEL